jgi:hypothetical protein
MHRIRPLAGDDLPALTRLYQKTWGDPGQPPDTRFVGYLEQLLLQNPWRDPAVPSLIYEDDDGSIIGFLGIHCRRMVFRGRPIRVAVSNSLMVDPERRRTLAGVQLQTALFAGPQDLSITDTANDASRSLWEHLGGISVPLYSLRWTRVLNPSRYALDWCAAELGWHPRGTRLVKPLVRALDRAAARLPAYDFLKDVSETAVGELDTKTLLDCLQHSAANHSLRPEYDLHSLAWLLDMATQKKQHGSLAREVVRNARDEVLGWYLYYRNPSACSEVLQFSALESSVHAVLHHLFRSAWRAGSVAVSGGVGPAYIRELSNNHCRLHAGPWLLAHSRNTELLHAICRGDAFLTRLEGEWWLRVLEFVH